MPKKKTVEQLVEELRLFHHNDSADQLERLDKLVDDLLEAQNEAWWDGYWNGFSSGMDAQ